MRIFQRLYKFAMAWIGRRIQDFDLWVIKKSCLGHVDGVAICDNSLAQSSPDKFLNATREAMALIKELDPKRYRRVCYQLKYIVNMELVGTGSYHRRFKICKVDFSRFSKLRPPRSVRRYASLLIHESTHGVVAEKGIPYDKDKRLRIERLCRREEYRFALHFEPGFADEAIGPFKAEQWKESWGPQQVRTAAGWKRLRESLMEYYFKRKK